jgi:thioredoxin 1
MIKQERIIMSDLIVNTTDTDFDQDVLQSDIPVLVDFWATWCGPCKSIAPILEDLANDYQGKVKIVKVDVDNNPQAASRFGIRNIPTLFVFKDGEKVDSVMGLQPKSELAKVLDKHL